jgi:uncharacterized membrane protein YeaQ/YmgE (transglycosylase-associated protein family)
MHDQISFYSWFWFLMVGGLAGWIASVLVQGSGLGLVGDIAAGVAGAFLGGFIAIEMNITIYGFWEVLAMSIVGAVILLMILRILVPRRRTAA